MSHKNFIEQMNVEIPLILRANADTTHVESQIHNLIKNVRTDFTKIITMTRSELLPAQIESHLQPLCILMENLELNKKD